ncbi:thymidylate synthase [Mycobacterium phage Kimona]|uniref:ThyX-like thymidylate synthase n=1 Tax=Mycobacterium phage Kimona TaxID=2024295 RepID=A0A249XU34_9CAUD|nr:thymidylate synthase [Mycobacterium phage Kimona]ASZ75484.1 ThyX-like thymidylate synthase [Mycobacterium phage Kimona]
MKVKLIAHTEVDRDALFALGYATQGYKNADELAEFAGRNCYRSFKRPNPATRNNNDYLKHIIDSGHESVLEHASATFYIEASRSVLTELERHRHLSFSVVSQRYVDATQLGGHLPPILDEVPDHIRSALSFVIDRATGEAGFAYRAIVSELEKLGFPRKQCREAARCVLPNLTNSPMVVSGNHRAWRYVIKARWHKAADAEIRTLAGLLLDELREIAPNTYQDIPHIPYS